MALSDALTVLDRALCAAADGACAAAALRGGEYVVCRPGCTPCCMGVFPISQADALRLARGLEALRRKEPARAAALAARARTVVARLGVLLPATALPRGLSEETLDRIESLTESEPCPALDPRTGLCDLYESRPLTCRLFGPAIRTEAGAIGICELCFEGASEAAIESSAVDFDADSREAPLLDLLERSHGASGHTIAALALCGDQPRKIAAEADV